MVGRWSDAATLKFIYLYKLHDCLWNTRSDFYTHKDVRNNALADIANQMGMEDFDMRSVKVKIKNLRAHYVTELKRVLVANAMGKNYEPTVYWYKELDSFLRDIVADSPSFQQPEVITADSIYDSSSIYENGAGPMDEDSLDKPLPVFHMQELPPARPKPRSRGNNNKRAVSNGSSTSTQRRKKRSPTPETVDEFEIFGRSVAMQLRKLSMTRALTAQTKIQVILTEERLHDLESATPPPEPIEPVAGTTENSNSEPAVPPSAEMTRSPSTASQNSDSFSQIMGSMLEPLIEMTTNLPSTNESSSGLNQNNETPLQPKIEMVTSLSTTNQKLQNLNELDIETEEIDIKDVPTFEESSISQENKKEDNTPADIKPVIKENDLPFEKPKPKSKKKYPPSEAPGPACKKRKAIIEKSKTTSNPNPVREFHIKPECDIITLDEDDPLEGTG